MDRPLFRGTAEKRPVVFENSLIEERVLAAGKKRYVCGKPRGRAIEIKHFQDFCEALKTEDRVCRKKFNTKKETPDRASLFVHIGGLCEKRG